MKRTRMQAKKLFPLLALLALLAAPAARGEAPGEQTARMDARMRELAVASQKNDFFKDYTYWNAVMYDTGCGPVSMANAMGVAFGVTDIDTVRAIAVELPDAMLPRRRRVTGSIVASGLPTLLNRMLEETDEESFPALSGLLRGYAGAYSLSGERLSQADIAAICAQQGEAMFVRTVAGRSMWPLLYDLCAALRDAGRADAVVCAGFLGVGTRHSGSPLYSTGSGHYVCVALHAGAFVEDGSIYLLDSLPRALANEPYGDGEAYRRPYPHFQDRRFARFAAVYDDVRIQPTVVRFTPRGEALEALHALAGDPDALREAHLSQLELFVLFGGGILLVSLPPAV